MLKEKGNDRFRYLNLCNQFIIIPAKKNPLKNPFYNDKKFKSTYFSLFLFSLFSLNTFFNDYPVVFLHDIVLYYFFYIIFFFLQQIAGQIAHPFAFLNNIPLSFLLSWKFFWEYMGVRFSLAFFKNYNSLLPINNQKNQ